MNTRKRYMREKVLSLLGGREGGKGGREGGMKG